MLTITISMPEFRWLLALPLLAQTGIAGAAQPVEEIVVTPNRIPVPIRQVGTSVAVLDQQEIAAHGNLALLDVLRQLPSVATSSNGGMGQPASLRIRGEEGFRTLAIIDGIRLSDPANTQIAPQFEHLLSSGIGRVEVLRGPQGLGYGADAGGVVALMTPQTGNGVQTAVEMQSGSYGTQQKVATITGGHKRGDFFASISDVSTDGFNVRSNDNLLRDNDGYDNTTLHARAGLDLDDAWRVEIAHRQVDGDSQFDDCGFGVVEHHCDARYNLAASRASVNYRGTRYSHSVSFSTTDAERDSLARGVSGFFTESSLRRWEYIGSVKGTSGVDLVFGADHEHATMPERQRSNDGYFIEALSELADSWYVTAGVRYDDNDDFGHNTSYRFSTAYLVDLAAGTLKLKGSAGTGFRAPSLYEIAYNRGPFSYAPAAQGSLQQEKSRGVETGIEYSANNGWQFEAVYFQQQVDDAIIFDLDNYSGYLQEFGESDSHGVELATKVPLTTALALQANYTWNPTERPDGSQRLRRPEQLANVGLQWQPRLQWNLNAFLRMSRDAIDQPFGGSAITLDDFAVLDLSASYQLDGWQLFGRIENALDERYEEVIGYNTAGVGAWIGIRLNFVLR